MSLSVVNAQRQDNDVAAHTLYTVPASAKLIGGNVHAVNVSGSAAGINIYVDPTAGGGTTDANSVYHEDWGIPPGGQVDIKGIALDTENAIIAYKQGTANAFTVTFSGLEIT